MRNLSPIEIDDHSSGVLRKNKSFVLFRQIGGSILERIHFLRHDVRFPADGTRKQFRRLKNRRAYLPQSKRAKHLSRRLFHPVPQIPLWWKQIPRSLYCLKSLFLSHESFECRARPLQPSNLLQSISSPRSAPSSR